MSLEREMELRSYVLEGTENLISPAIVYYKDIILYNTKRVIEMAGGPGRLWPHVKSHKSSAMIRMQMDLGINRFKCATISEAEMTADSGAGHIILAYPLIGPNVLRYIELTKAFPKTVFYAIADDLDSLSILADVACREGTVVNILIDVNMGMNRTGVSLDLLESFCESCAALKGIKLKGMHCYDGHCRDSDFNIRKAIVEKNDAKVLKIRELLKRKGFEFEIMVMGGSPSFPCRAGKEGFYLSPGTIFIGDWTYFSILPDMVFTPGAALFSRVISHSGSNANVGNCFTLDLGCKGIASDPPGDRGVIVGLPEANPVFQSEEHWVFSLPENAALPPVGSECYVIPAHICPTSALYPEILVAQGGKITERWPVDARNRKITY